MPKLYRPRAQEQPLRGSISLMRMSNYTHYYNRFSARLLRWLDIATDLQGYISEMLPIESPSDILFKPVYERQIVRCCIQQRVQQIGIRRASYPSRICQGIKSVHYNKTQRG
jgi:hypothetical protein